MGLVDRLGNLQGPEVPNVAFDVFWAALYELAKGKVTRQQIINYFELVGDEVTDLDYIIGRYNAQPNATAKASFVETLRAVFMLAESKVPGYSTRAQLVARIDAI